MRELKFRAWDSNFKKWIRLNGHLGNTFWGEGTLLGVQEYITLHRYTGLCDKNDKKVYEGDIVRTWNGNKSFLSHDGFQFCIGKRRRPVDLYEVHHFEVIGNIYENPELLEAIK